MKGQLLRITGMDKKHLRVGIPDRIRMGMPEG